ncbi:MFS transporter [Nonomuraea sp. K274]|uniref:MFS transporter n=1 Tax=Nonomuraea cypriaca TaxID=1187855 RepID=A0A931A6W6_9ACTN|nr:MFS transporter [Nonomuraea cypriaca]MBF8187482.1 MFS transporter [Nonomuraea cypriaca]
MPAVTSAATPLRAARAAVFAVVAFTLGGLAHVFAGGVVPFESAVTAIAVCFVPAFLLAGRERSLPVIVVTLAATQAALHLLFSATDVIAEAAGHAEHPHIGLVPSLGMLIMHGWAIALTALWMSHGETLLWSLLRRLAVRLRIVQVLSADPIAHEPARAPFREPAVLRSALLAHELCRRGPPHATRAHAV